MPPTPQTRRRHHVAQLALDRRAGCTPEPRSHRRTSPSTTEPGGGYPAQCSRRKGDSKDIDAVAETNQVVRNEKGDPNEGDAATTRGHDAAAAGQGKSHAGEVGRIG